MFMLRRHAGGANHKGPKKAGFVTVDLMTVLPKIYGPYQGSVQAY